MSTDNLNIQSDFTSNNNSNNNDEGPLDSLPHKIGRVFMLEQNQNVDVTPAFDFGPIVPLFKATNGNDKINNKKIDRPSMWKTEEFQDAIIQKLEEYKYDPEKDYILVAGHIIPIVCCVAAIIMNWEEAEHIQVLFWSSSYNKYVVRKL